MQTLNQRRGLETRRDYDRRRRQETNLAEIVAGAVMLTLLLVCIADRIVESVLS